jgi:hypothetical protein
MDQHSGAERDLAYWLAKRDHLHETGMRSMHLRRREVRLATKAA